MTNVQQTEFVISDDNKTKIDHCLTKYPKEQKRSAVIAALLFVQQQNGGYLSEAAMDAVAHYLDLPPIEVYEVATFYDMYELEQVGKHKIAICNNVSCHLRGSGDIIACVEKRLGIKVGETSKDGMFTLREVECMAACAGAPMCQIDDKQYHENLTSESMLALINELARGAAE